MSKFAKLFEIGDDQVLVYFEYEMDTDETIIHQVTTVGDIRADMKVAIIGAKQEASAEIYLREFGQEQAENLRHILVDMLNG